MDDFRTDRESYHLAAPSEIARHSNSGIENLAAGE
jgi:hypothetical protein